MSSLDTPASSPPASQGDTAPPSSPVRSPTPSSPLQNTPSASPQRERGGKSSKKRSRKRNAADSLKRSGVSDLYRVRDTTKTTKQEKKSILSLVKNKQIHARKWEHKEREIKTIDGGVMKFKMWGSEAVMTLNEPPQPTQRPTCSVCGKKCQDKSALRKHMGMHKKKPFSCLEEKCKMVFSGPSKLRKHEISEHKKDGETGEFSCGYYKCMFKAETKPDLTVHLRAKHPQYKPIDTPKARPSGSTVSGSEVKKVGDGGETNANGASPGPVKKVKLDGESAVSSKEEDGSASSVKVEATAS